MKMSVRWAELCQNPLKVLRRCDRCLWELKIIFIYFSVSGILWYWHIYDDKFYNCLCLTQKYFERWQVHGFKDLYPCKQCETKFPSKWTLSEHQREHYEWWSKTWWNVTHGWLKSCKITFAIWAQLWQGFKCDILSGQNFIKIAKYGQLWHVSEDLKLAIKQCYLTNFRRAKVCETFLVNQSFFKNAKYDQFYRLFENLK